MQRLVVDSASPHGHEPAGTPWRPLLDEAAAPGAGCDGAALERHLEILLAVCKTVQFSHERGFVHRDLRPEHVLVWGSARVDVLGWGADAGDGDAHGRGADVFALGAVLRELVTGDPSRDDGDASAAPACEPRAPASGLAMELAAIWTKAMAPRADLRHAAVEELRLDVAEALARARSQRAAAVGATRVDELRSLLESALRDPAGARPAIGTVMSAYALIGACRSTLLEALRLSPTSTDARAQLEKLTDLVTAFELAQGEHGAALRLVAELGPFLPDGGARHERELQGKLERAKAKGTRSVAAPQDDAAPDASAHFRVRRAAFVAVSSVGAAAVYLLLGWLTRTGRLAYPHLLFAGVNALMALGLVLRRERLQAPLGGDAAARRTVVTILAVTASATIVFPVAWLTGVPFGWAIGMQLLVYALVAFLSSHAIDPPHLGAAVPHALGFVAAMNWPAIAWEALGAACILANVWQPPLAKVKERAVAGMNRRATDGAPALPKDLANE